MGVRVLRAEGQVGRGEVEAAGGHNGCAKFCCQGEKGGNGVKGKEGLSLCVKVGSRVH